MKLQYQKYNTIFFLLGLFFVIVFLAKINTIHIESLDVGYIKRILHPEYPQGGISYDPQFHYNYIVAFVARVFGFESNSSGLAQIFWFIEQALTIAVLIKFCGFLFKGDKLTLVLVIFMYLMLKSGETDQKTMLRPLHFLAIYYFLKEKWILAAIFSASIFYLHIGVAIWWFVPSCFALCLVYLFKNKNIDFFQIIMFSGVVCLLASPIVYYYIVSTVIGENFTNNEFINHYWYGVVNNSVLYEIIYDPKALAILLLKVTVLTVGYKKWILSGGSNDYIVPIAFGVLCLYILDFVLVDIMFSGIFIKLQLLRSVMNIDFFMSLFFVFLISRQLGKGNIVFFVLFLMILCVPSSFWVYYSPIDRWSGIFVFYAVVTVYEIFEHPIGIVMGNLSVLLGNRTIVPLFCKITGKMQNLFSNPVSLSVFLVILVALQGALSATPIKTYVKSVIGIKQTPIGKMNFQKSLNKDIAKYTNEKINGDDVLLVFPFAKSDFVNYTNHKVFINAGTLFDYVPSQIDHFQHIFENDLNYSIEKLRSEGSWEEMWKGVDEDLILKWRREYDITHVIRENEFPLDFSAVYENEYYTIYDLRL